MCEFVLSVLVLYMQARSVLQHATRPTDLVAILFLLLTTQVTTLIYDTCRSTSNKVRRKDWLRCRYQNFPLPLLLTLSDLQMRLYARNPDSFGF